VRRAVAPAGDVRTAPVAAASPVRRAVAPAGDVRTAPVAAASPARAAQARPGLWWVALSLLLSVWASALLWAWTVGRSGHATRESSLQNADPTALGPDSPAEFLKTRVAALTRAETERLLAQDVKLASELRVRLGRLAETLANHETHLATWAATAERLETHPVSTHEWLARWVSHLATGAGIEPPPGAGESNGREEELEEHADDAISDLEAALESLGSRVARARADLARLQEASSSLAQEKVATEAATEALRAVTTRAQESSTPHGSAGAAGGITAAELNALLGRRLATLAADGAGLRDLTQPPSKLLVLHDAATSAPYSPSCSYGGSGARSSPWSGVLSRLCLWSQGAPQPESVFMPAVPLRPCWRFGGARGRVSAVFLDGPTLLSGLAVEHNAAALLPVHPAGAAPRRVRLLGLNLTSGAEEHVAELEFALSGSSVQLARAERPLGPFHGFRAEVLDNYGAEYTCLLRLRVLL
jgi:hypothetical protein